MEISNQLNLFFEEYEKQDKRNFIKFILAHFPPSYPIKIEQADATGYNYWLLLTRGFADERASGKTYQGINQKEFVIQRLLKNKKFKIGSWELNPNLDRYELPVKVDKDAFHQTNT